MAAMEQDEDQGTTKSMRRTKAKTESIQSTRYRLFQGVQTKEKEMHDIRRYTMSSMSGLGAGMNRDRIVTNVRSRKGNEQP